MEFRIRVGRKKVSLVSLPKEYAKAHPGFMSRLPKALKERDLETLDAILGHQIDSGYHTVTIEKNRNGRFIVGAVSRGRRKEEKVVRYKKILINRDTGEGVKLCIIPDELIGKRVSVNLFS